MALPQIFLSYAREDVSAAKRLCDDLRTKGRKVWFDKDCLRGGEKWRIAINKAIRESDFFVALLSGESVTKRGMVQAEIQQALNVLEEIPEDRIYLIPVRLTECEPSHTRLSELHWVDLFPQWRDGVEEILRSTDRDSGVPDLSDGPSPLDDILKSMATFHEQKMALSGTIRVSEAVRQVIDIFGNYAAERNVEVRFQDKAPNASLKINKNHFITAVSNILNNAIKYSYTLPKMAVRVDISTEETIRGVKLKVANWGVGISQDEISTGQIFQRGYRGRGAYDHSVTGTGIGLFLAKQVCDEYSGTIQIHSRPVRSPSRKGSSEPHVTTVTVILPSDRLDRIIVDLGGDLPPVSVPYDPNFSLREFINTIYFRLGRAVKPYTFGHSWMLVDTENERRMIEFEPDCNPGTEPDVDFQFSEVGLRPGQRFRVEFL